MTNITPQTLAGTWRLKDAYAEKDGVKQAFPLGEGTHGLIMYDDIGHMSAQLMSHERVSFSARTPKDIPLEEISRAYHEYTSYFGTYTLDVDAGTITHHVEGALAPQWIGGDQLRYFAFDGATLTLTTPPMKVADGSKVVNTLVWEKASKP
ncbi:MAG: lipocalin-like domain-containing protein [Pseudomonadota bacterium]